RLKADVAPGTYWNNLEIFCAVNGNFASGPLAPVTVPAEAVVAPAPPAPAPVELPRTGTAPLLALGALLLVGAGLGVRRFVR
ncbi:MAG: LPXTG cell wall anchor domain-containing protein, partial [Frankiales bacterium]